MELSKTLTTIEGALPKFNTALMALMQIMENEQGLIEKNDLSDIFMVLSEAQRQITRAVEGGDDAGNE